QRVTRNDITLPSTRDDQPSAINFAVGGAEADVEVKLELAESPSTFRTTEQRTASLLVDTQHHEPLRR
ncbi:unnamed protein product, partial [Amoebophrya sp. A25]